LCVLWGDARMSRAQDVAKKEAPLPSGKDWLEQRTNEFESYRFALEGLQPMALTMETRSLLNWSNAERGTFFGAVFLWTYEGRPAWRSSSSCRGPIRSVCCSWKPQPRRRGAMPWRARQERR